MPLTLPPPNSTLTRFVPLIERLVSKGGPEASDYAELDFWLHDLATTAASGKLEEVSLQFLRSRFGRALSTDTMQGFALAKPHGYAGDFEIIDRIYTVHRSSDPRLQRWDDYYHQQAAPRAVRNRKLMLHRLLDERLGEQSTFRVLKIAVGPGRSMYEWLERHPNADVHFDCVEIDEKAINYASELNQEHLERVRFHKCNALRFRPQQSYDLIWIAGLFDYFADTTFVKMVKKLYPHVKIGGELVIGNFSDSNPSRAYMELLGEWYLNHRSESKLQSLAGQAGVSAESTSVMAEPSGVNLFLRLKSRLS